MGRGCEAVTAEMFTPRINKPKKKKDEDEESETSDTPAQKAYKKQQAHVEYLYWWEPTYTETVHYKR